jgi:hypothetical protein
MAKSLSGATDVFKALQDTQWRLLESLAKLTDDREAEARQALGEVATALQTDEYATPLAGVLRQTAQDAVRLLTQVSSQTTLQPQGRDVNPRPTVSKPSTQQTATTEEGQEAGLDEGGWLRVTQNLARKLRDNPKLRLSVNWLLEEDTDEQQQTPRCRQEQDHDYRTTP